MADQKKIALITGASKGIGKAIAMGLAESGFFTVLIGRNEKDLCNVAEKTRYKFFNDMYTSISRLIESIKDY